jgi:hypothetical protein
MSLHEPQRFWSSRSGIVLLGFLAIAAFFLLTEHTAHVLGALPWLLLAACPLMHLFHHGHGGHKDARGDPHSIPSNGPSSGEHQ